MRANEFITEKHISTPTRSQCKGGRSLSRVRYNQCVSLGYLAHDSDHTDGSGTQGKKGSGTHLRGKKGAKGQSERHGGVVKDYSGK
jgi:hypothetical protein